MQRRQTKQTPSPKDRLASFAKEARDKALKLRPGLEKDALLKSARQAEVVSHMDEWANSPGLRPPK
jgi:hypothetical protein